MRFFASEKTTWSHRKGKNQKPATLNNFLHASSLLIEAIFLKAKSHEKLGALEGATRRLLIDLVLVPFGFMPLSMDRWFAEESKVV